MNKYYIVSGTAEQARVWAQKNMSLGMEYVYVYGPEVLRGVSNPKGIFTGTWDKRPDIKEIVKMLVINTDKGKLSQRLSMIYSCLVFNIDPKSLKETK